MASARETGEWPPNIKAILKRPAPASAYLGLEVVDCDVEAGTVELAFNASDQLCNLWGGIHGGMVAAMMDDILAIAVGLTLEWGQISPTLEMKVSMLSVAKPGRLTGRGRVLRRGKSVVFVEGELLDAEGTLLAKGSSTCTLVTLKKKDDRTADKKADKKDGAAETAA
ncbi:PaaI family thioesterase [Pyruvatibacter mobilis]|uniref:PaaI family thioesterase n=1 Tax=Pyruvatibacter mobilis TaxID=1712261 RepID=UPI003BB1C066